MSSLTTLYVIVAGITAAANLGIAAADLARPQFVLANSAEVGVPPYWITPLAACKAAGGLGLLAGLAGFTVIGVAAAAGLVLFFVGAVAVHVHTRVLHNLAFPLTYLLLAVASLILAL
jgi:hypothetical protein